PKVRQWQIAMGLCTAATLSMALALLYMSHHYSAAHGEEPSGDVVLYTSVDTMVYTPIVAEFENQYKIKVKVVPDTEATKTTGLVARLRSERAKPRADVWWSSEPMGSVTLAKSGILEPFVSKAETDFKEGWPAYLRAKDKTWYGFAQRARVMAYNT